MIIKVPVASTLLPIATIIAGLIAVAGVVYSARVLRDNATKERANALDRTEKALAALRVALNEDREGARRQRAEDFELERTRRAEDLRSAEVRRLDERVIDALVAVDSAQEVLLEQDVELGRKLLAVRNFRIHLQANPALPELVVLGVVRVLNATIQPFRRVPKSSAFSMW